MVSGFIRRVTLNPPKPGHAHKAEALQAHLGIILDLPSHRKAQLVAKTQEQFSNDAFRRLETTIEGRGALELETLEKYEVVSGSPITVSGQQRTGPDQTPGVIDLPYNCEKFLQLHQRCLGCSLTARPFKPYGR